MKKILTLLALSFFLQAPLAFAGHELGNGGDYLTQNDRMGWFWGKDRTILYCIQLAEDAGVQESLVDDTIQSTFMKWAQYVFDRKVTPKLDITLRLAKLPQCTGREDLKFYIGSNDASSDTAKLQFKEPFGFAVRTDFDPIKRWGKGFIWIAKNHLYENKLPDWNINSNLYTILLHEWGHIFGCEHVEGTIMTENIAQEILNPIITSEFRAGKRRGIDGKNNLIICDQCEFIDYSPISDEVFTRFIGHAPNGKPSAVLHLRPYAQDYLGELSFLDDAQKLLTFVFVTMEKEKAYESEAVVFSFLHPSRHSYVAKFFDDPILGPPKSPLNLSFNNQGYVTLTMTDEKEFKTLTLFDSSLRPYVEKYYNFRDESWF